MPYWLNELYKERLKWCIMVSSNLGKVKLVGKEFEIKSDVCCLIHSFISHFGLIEFQRILSLVGHNLEVDIFEK